MIGVKVTVSVTAQSMGQHNQDAPGGTCSWLGYSCGHFYFCLLELNSAGRQPVRSEVLSKRLLDCLLTDPPSLFPAATASQALALPESLALLSNQAPNLTGG